MYISYVMVNIMLCRPQLQPTGIKLMMPGSSVAGMQNLLNINLLDNISLRKCLHQRILAAASIRVDPDHELAHTI